MTGDTKRGPGRGGARPGAGRPKTGRTKITVTVSLAPDVVEFLNKQPGKKSSIIEDAVRIVIERDK